MKYSLVASTILVIAAVLMPTDDTRAARKCIDGSMSRPITAAEIASAPAGSFPSGADVCPEDVAAGISGDAGQAKQYLNKSWCGGKAGSSGGFTSNVEQLDNKFAVCIAKFMQQYKTRDPSLCLTSAYRSTAHQAAICGKGRDGCAPPGRSNHQRGIAVDFRAKNYQDMHSAVRAFAGGGLRHLMLANDPYHVEATSNGICGTGSAASNDGPAPSSSPSPFSSPSGLQNLFGQQQPQTQTGGQAQTSCPTGLVLINGQCMPQQNIDRLSAQDILPPPIQTSNPASTTTTGSTNINYNSNSNSNSNTASSTTATIHTGPSAIDLIGQIAFPSSTTATTSVTSGPVQLINGITGQATLQGTRPQDSEASSTYTMTPSQMQTFTSQDLTKTPSQPGIGTNSRWQVLESLRLTLLSVLQYLQPFGGQKATQYSTTDAEYLE